MKGSVGTGRRTPHVAFNPNVAETTTLLVLTRSVLFLITVINIGVGVDDKAGITYLGWRSDFLKRWGGRSNWSRRGENENKLGRGRPDPSPHSLAGGCHVLSCWGWPKADWCWGRGGTHTPRVCVHGRPCRPGTVSGRADTRSRLRENMEMSWARQSLAGIPAACVCGPQRCLCARVCE